MVGKRIESIEVVDDQILHRKIDEKMGKSVKKILGRRMVVKCSKLENRFKIL